jgi:NADH pyrophosphatase NudC (nudix superfamily)
MLEQLSDRVLIRSGWVCPEEAVGLYARINRLTMDLMRATMCPECGRKLEPKRCEHCHGDYSIDA